MLYPPELRGPALTKGQLVVPPILLRPPSVSGHHDGPGDTWPGVCYTPSPALAATGPNSPRSPPAGPGPPALLPWSPRLRASVTGQHPRLSGELSPLPVRRSRAGRSSLCCGCRRAPSREARPRLLFHGAHLSLSGSRSGAAGPRASRAERKQGSGGSREVPLARWGQRRTTGCLGKVQCGRGDSNSHPQRWGLGPQPSASANSATSAFRDQGMAPSPGAEGESRTRTGVKPTAP